MTLLAYALVNLQAAGLSQQAFDDAFSLPCEAVHPPDIDDQSATPVIVVDLQSSELGAIKQLAQRLNAANWGYGVLASDASLRRMRQHFRSITSVQDINGQWRDWFWHDPRHLQALLGHVNTATQAACLFDPVQLYVVPDGSQLRCLQWTGNRIEVSEQ